MVRATQAEHALRASEARFRHIVESATEYAIISMGPDRKIASWNSGAERLMGYAEAEAVGRSADIFFTKEDCDAGAPQYEMNRALAKGRAANERWHVRKDGSRFWGSGAMLPLENGAGFLKIFRDHTDRRLAEERQKVLIDELDHRVKNTLATVQALTMQTLRGSRVEPDVATALHARLSALAMGHDILTQGSWTGGDLRQIVESALTAFRTGSDRVRIDGPPVQVSPRVTLALTLALHELATNATKYGALSKETGRIDIAWDVDQPADRLHFRWVESDGPPVVPPQRKGFGSRLIERSLAGDLGAGARIEYAPSGVVWTIDASLRKLQGH